MTDIMAGMSEDFGAAKLEYKKSLTRFVFFLAFATLFIGIGMWYFYVFSNPEKTFWDTVDANLRVKSYSRVTSEELPNSKISNITTMQFGEQDIARDVAIFNQTGEQELTQVTESIGTEDKNFFAYQQVEGDIMNASGDVVDTSSVTGLYGVIDLNSPAALGLPQTYQNAVSGPQLTIPFASLSRNQRVEMVSFIKDNNIFEVDFENASKNKVNGRTAYIYSVTVSIEGYIKMLQKLDEMNDTELFSGIDASVQAGQSVELIMAIDINARQLLELEFVGQGQKEQISGYNGHYNISEPEEFIEFSELNQRIQELLQ